MKDQCDRLQGPIKSTGRQAGQGLYLVNGNLRGGGLWPYSWTPLRLPSCSQDHSAASVLRSHQPELQSQDNLQAEFPDLVPVLLFPGKHLASMFLQSSTQPSLDTLQRVQQTFFFLKKKFSLIRVQLADILNEVEDISFQPQPFLISFQVPPPPMSPFISLPFVLSLVKYVWRSFSVPQCCQLDFAGTELLKQTRKQHSLKGNKRKMRSGRPRVSWEEHSRQRHPSFAGTGEWEAANGRRWFISGRDGSTGQGAGCPSGSLLRHPRPTFPL